MGITRLGRAGLFAGLIAIALLCRADATTAQETLTTTAQETLTPFVLTEKQMEGYVAALPEMALAKRTMPRTTEAGEIEFWTAVLAIAKKHGFVEYDQFALVSATVAHVMSGFDPQTKVFAEPKVELEENISYIAQLIDELKAGLMSDPSETSPTDLARLLPLRQFLDEMKEAHKRMEATTPPENVELVRKHFDKIVMIANSPGGVKK
jgi:hypothetical protein